MEGAPEHPTKSIGEIPHMLDIDHTAVWYMQGEASNSKALDYYPSVDQIVQELSRQTKTKIPVPEVVKQVDFSIEEPLTDQEKEEYYELNIYISTFVSEDIPIEPTGRVQIIIKPPAVKRDDPQPTEPQPQPQQKTTLSAPVSVTPTQVPMGEVDPDNPEYALSQGIIKKLAAEIVAARKKIKAQKVQQGKGKHKLIIAESSDDEEELVATALDIIEDAATNKVPVETQFQWFIEAGAPEGRPKKEKTTTTPKNVVDLVLTPPPTSPTQIVEEKASTQ